MKKSRGRAGCRCRSSQILATVRVCVVVPLEDAFRVTKGLLRSKRAKIEAVDREGMTLQCASCKRVWR